MSESERAREREREKERVCSSLAPSLSFEIIYYYCYYYYFRSPDRKSNPDGLSLSETRWATRTRQGRNDIPGATYRGQAQFQDLEQLGIAVGGGGGTS